MAAQRPPSPPPPPPESRGSSKSRSGRPLDFGRRGSRQDRLQDFARTGFPGYSRVQVAERRKRGAIGLLIILIVGVAFVLTVLRLQRVADSSEGLEAASTSAEANLETSSGKADPDLWRSDIAAIEALLFEPPSSTGPLVGFGPRFRDTAGPWVDRLRAEGGTRAVALADKVDRLIDRSQRSDFNIRRLQEVQKGWLEARAFHLDQASWMVEGDRGSARAEYDVYRQAAERISALVGDALSEGETLAAAGLASEQHSREWGQVLFHLGDDLKVLRASLPRRPPSSASAEMLATISVLDRVFNKADRLVSQQRDPVVLDREAFERAIDEAEEAAAEFDRRFAQL